MRKFRVFDRTWDADDKPGDRVFEITASGFRVERSGALVFYVGAGDTHAFRSFDYVEEVR